MTPISEMGQNYQVDPINDLRTACPNCHSMLHKTNPPLKIKELKEEIKKHDPPTSTIANASRLLKNEDTTTK